MTLLNILFSNRILELKIPEWQSIRPWHESKCDVRRSYIKGYRTSVLNRAYFVTYKVTVDRLAVTIALLD